MTTSANNATYRLFVGVDIAAITSKVSWPVPGKDPTRAISIEQTPQAFAVLQQRLLSMGHPANTILVVMEATGSYWIRLATTLTQAGFVVSVINLAQALHFARALLKGAKTDAIDAQTLSQLACLLQAAPPREGEHHSLAYRPRLLFLDHWNLWHRLTRYRTWKGPKYETLDGTNNACECAIGWWIKERSRTMRGYKLPENAVRVSRLLV
jgi:hypothetical protein